MMLLLAVGCGEPTADLHERLAEVTDSKTARQGALVAGLWVHGEARWTHEHQATLDTPFRVGSISKVVTAVGVLKLHQAGVIDIDAPLEDALPTFAIRYHEGESGVLTARHLLSHHGGIPSDLLPGMFSHDAPYLTYRTESLADEFASHAPGEWWSYSNSGYTVLGHLIEAASGKSYADFLVEEVFAPCGMADTHFELPEATPATLKGRPLNEGAEQTDLPAGGLVSTAHDLVRLAEVLQGADCDGGPLLDAAMREQMHTPTHVHPFDLDLRAGLGLELEPESPLLGGLDRVGHDGDTLAYHARLGWLPEAGAVAVALTSEANAGGDATTFVDAALELAAEDFLGRDVIGSEPTAESTKGPSPFSRDDIEALAGTYGTQIGLFDLKRRSNGLVGKLAGFKVKLVPTEAKTFRVRPIVVGVVLPMLVSDIEVGFFDVDGTVVMGMKGQGISRQWTPMGARFSVGAPSGAWSKRLGSWLPLNNGDDLLRIDEVVLEEDDGRLLMTTLLVDPIEEVELTYGMQVVDDEWMRTGGSGRRAGETVRAVEVDGETHLFVQGTEFVRASDRGGCSSSPISLMWWAAASSCGLLCLRRRRGVRSATDGSLNDDSHVDFARARLRPGRRVFRT